MTPNDNPKPPAPYETWLAVYREILAQGDDPLPVTLSNGDVYTFEKCVLVERYVFRELLAEREAKDAPRLEEVFADNGEHSHWRLVDPSTGDVLWGQEEREAKDAQLAQAKEEINEANRSAVRAQQIALDAKSKTASETARADKFRAELTACMERNRVFEQGEEEAKRKAFEFEQQLQQAKENRDFIPVTERLPEYDCECIVICSDYPGKAWWASFYKEIGRFDRNNVRQWVEYPDEQLSKLTADLATARKELEAANERIKELTNR